MPREEFDLESFENCRQAAGKGVTSWLLSGQRHAADGDVMALFFLAPGLGFAVCLILLAGLAGACRCACFCRQVQGVEALARVLQRAVEIDLQFASSGELPEDSPNVEGKATSIFAVLMFGLMSAPRTTTSPSSPS
ncbi:unnamed protein product [Prorocentrum cordatum]|uniref:Uncharacterized protein n=1 Tax=Prorocentrum cordatum TaxID=2364126 RepID=A0ABN9Y172_9DINO|nr:unnamed protein product [Polarella glacialis]